MYELSFTVADLHYKGGSFYCANGKCTVPSWWLDGDNDCGDGSDEGETKFIPISRAILQFTITSILGNSLDWSIFTDINNVSSPLL